MYSKSVVLIAILLSASGATAGISTLAMISNGHSDPTEMMPTFSSYSELSCFLDGAGRSFWQNDSWGTSGAPDTTQQKETYSGVPGYSRTNVQVSGVDEADTVKTDGEYVYIASSDCVTIVKAYPGDALSIAGNITYDVLAAKTNSTMEHPSDSQLGISVSGLYLLPGRLVVIASAYYWTNCYGGGEYYALDYKAEASSIAYGAYSMDRTMIFIFDISDVGNPSLLGSFSVSGYPLTSRMQGGIVYSISQQYIQRQEDGRYDVPESQNGSDGGDLPVGDIHYDPETNDAGYFMNIMALDVSELKSKSISVVEGWSSTIYMSTESLYLTIAKWPATPVTIMPDVQFRALSQAKELPTTSIYRIDVNGTHMHIVAKGNIRGVLDDQFSMDEKEGYLRVAAYNGDWGDRRNAVYIMDSNLIVVGSIKDIAVNETIQSSRFVGDRLYLVTFRQVDPLFVIDLSVPTAPKILGELTIPGFSTYLQPVDEGHILGIGTENGTLKVSLYDVSDPTKPKEDAKYVFSGYAYSSSQYEHKAVLFNADTGMLVIPAIEYGYNYTSGFYVFNVSAGASTVVLRGVISHGNPSYYWADCVRALYIGEYLYTISDSIIMANELSDLSVSDSLVYHEGYWQSGPYYGVVESGVMSG
jgi:uncharacterized secreted protein with C-terminal beta-propeller domain